MTLRKPQDFIFGLFCLLKIIKNKFKKVFYFKNKVYFCHVVSNEATIKHLSK